jgi:MGT family glycosyltransferase
MRSRRFLFTHWEGGGNTPPMLAIVRRLIMRGHDIRVMSDPYDQTAVETTGAAFRSWTRAPHRFDMSPETDPVRDWEGGSPLTVLARIRDRMFVGPALGYAEDIVEELRRAPADVVVTSETLFGAMVGAEAEGVPCVALAANVYLFPRPGVPPFGPGLLPARTIIGQVRDWVIRTIALREFGKATAAFNETRRRFGLSPVKHPFDQLQYLAAHLVLTSAAFDFPSTNPPPHIVYAGPELEDPHWTGSWRSPWGASDRRPLVLVGFSSTYQNQAGVLARVIEALRALDVRAVVTTGPAIDVAALPAAPNVYVCTSAPHSAVLREARAAVTHAGHGTVIRALAAGVPLVCMPMGRDQNDTAARVVFHGAGMRLAPTAPAHKIRAAVHEVLQCGRYGARARALGALIREDARTSRAVPVLESIADRKHGAALNDHGARTCEDADVPGTTGAQRLM